LRQEIRLTELKMAVRSVRADVSDTNFALVDVNLIDGESPSSLRAACGCRRDIGSLDCAKFLLAKRFTVELVFGH
jgi:hypothetical protein